MGRSATHRQWGGSTTEPPRAFEANQLVDHFFRHESGRILAWLTGVFGPGNIHLAEDVVQEALLRAVQTWPYAGIPKNPSAWIARVSRNLALDFVRHRRLALAKETEIIRHLEQTGPEVENVAPRFEDEIRDDVLRMMFVCCHPMLPRRSQVALILRTLCGFGTSEIAHLFLSSKAAVEKQLTRARRKLRESGVFFELPSESELAARLDAVLESLYLLFSEGHKASSGPRLVREELCHESIRLTRILVDHPAGNRPKTHALLALLLLTAARLSSRVDESGNLLRLNEQSRTEWNGAFIAQGLQHLAHSASEDDVGEYHLQAGIAACHCVAPDYESTDWARILALYDELAGINPSPVVAMNRAVAVANVRGAHAGVHSLLNTPNLERLQAHCLFHSVMGELQAQLNDFAGATQSYRRALELAEVAPESAFFENRLRLVAERQTAQSDGSVGALRPS